MRARELHEENTNRANAMYSIIRDFHTSDPKVIETFNRPPYAPVLNFKKEEAAHEC